MDMSVWFLMGTALVFFMQCGFAMVEAGFTRAKNVGNITMKNLMDFCIGTVAFYLLGYNLLCGDGKFVGWGLNPFIQMPDPARQSDATDSSSRWYALPHLLPVPDSGRRRSFPQYSFRS